ncbi:MAG: transposase, partial [Candidatus Doudnabacteria bacterium]|nr:transposase [Candidatus Doudnabacteria bacterium]
SLIIDTKKTGVFLVHHYCFMSSHFHLAVRIRSLPEFSGCFQEIKREYTFWFNRKYKRRGPLWRERFKSLLIENEGYLHACGKYIEFNPVKAGMIKSPEQWAYSSAGFYFKKISDPLVDGYEFPEMPKGIDPQEEVFFTRGVGIGSGLFKLYLRDALQAV